LTPDRKGHQNPDLVFNFKSEFLKGDAMGSKNGLTADAIKKRLDQLEIDIVLKQLELVELQKRKGELQLLLLHKQNNIEE
jgi:hypothetical protein